MERSKQIAMNFFAGLGYAVTEITEADGKRADLDVHDGIDQYIVEVKEKLDTGSQIEIESAGHGGSTYQVGREPHSRSNRLDGVLKHGTKQLNATPSCDNAFKLIWLHTEGINSDMMARRALYTFFGVATLIPAAGGGDGVNCVYFDYSTAFASPSVNGLVIVEDDSLQLCLNEFSPNYTNFQCSRLVCELGKAVYDPAKFGSQDGTIVVRSDISRKDENAILNELKRATGIQYTRIQMNRYTFG